MYIPANLRIRALISVLLPIACGMLLAGCGSRPLLYDVAVEPDAITPDQDGDADVARIRYAIGAPVTLTITFTGLDGQDHRFRDAKQRSPGTYEALFGGVVGGRMLPDGEYTVRIAAVPRDEPAGAGVIEERKLVVRGGDTAPPELAGFTVQPTEFTPNQDGLGDRVAISYRLDEAADVRVWLETAAGEYVTDILEEKESADYPGAPGAHVYDFDAGVDADAPPPPDGEYVIVGQATDGAGNVSVQRLPLRISDGGQPKVALLGDVDWSDTFLPLGATLTFTVTVKNMGDTPIRTRGPEPGFVYDNDTTFNQAAPAELILLARSAGRATSVRIPAGGGDVGGVVLDLDSGPGAGLPAAATRPQHDLVASAGTAPDTGGIESADDAVEAPARITVCGTVFQGKQPVAGAEVFAFEPDGDNGVRAVADPNGEFCFPELAVPPPHERSYARSPGAIRLGLEYDEVRTSLAYPYRWQLGRTADLAVCESDDRLYLCLLPDQTVTITGSVRFVESPFRRSTQVYLALMHEDVRRMQGPYGQQRITIEY